MYADDLAQAEKVYNEAKKGKEQQLQANVQLKNEMKEKQDEIRAAKSNGEKSERALQDQQRKRRVEEMNLQNMTAAKYRKTSVT